LHAVTLEEAREYYSDADSAHGFDHVLRVLALAGRIGEVEGADAVVLRTAALLHDIGRAEEMESGRSHAEAGAERARLILSDWPPAAADAVVHAIAAHRFRDDVVPETLEARVLFDADKLDSIGAIGVARAYAVAGLRGQPLWGEVQPGYAQAEHPHELSGRQGQASGHTPAHEFTVKLSRIKDILFTDTAKKIAEDRDRFMGDFFARLEREVRGEL
jgi:uncharacterized protein